MIVENLVEMTVLMETVLAKTIAACSGADRETDGT